MNSKHCRSILSILVCVAMVLTQMVPLSFADTVSPSDGQTVSADISADTSAADEQQNAEDSVSDIADTENDNAEAQPSDDSEKGGFSGFIESVKDAAASLFGTDDAEEAEDTEGTEEQPTQPTEPEEDLNPEISWYINDTNKTVFEISNADQLRGFAKIVNGTAVKVVKGENGAENTTEKVSSFNFAEKTVKLTDDIDLGNEPWTPIGFVTAAYATSNSENFSGTFDGDGHTISGFYIDDSPWTVDSYPVYAGLFGCVNNATGTMTAAVRNVTIKGNIELTNKGTIRSNGRSKTVYVGGAVAYAYNTVNITNVHTDINYASNEKKEDGTKNAIASLDSFGGITAYIYQGSIADCTASGSYDADETSSGGIGGIVGTIGKYDFAIDSCISNLDIASHGQYIGGILGFNNNDNVTVTNCENNGDLKCYASITQKLNYIGGIVGRSQAKWDCGIVNSVNNGNIETVPDNGGLTSLDVCAGGMIGSDYSATVENTLNTGNIVIPYNDEAVKITAGGIAGVIDRAKLRNSVNTGKIVYKDYNMDSNDHIGQICAVDLSSYSQGGYLLENLFTSENKTSSLPLIAVKAGDEELLAEVTDSIGIIKKNNTVSAYGDYGLLYDTDSLGGLLNNYVIKKGNSQGTMRLWTLDGKLYKPEGIQVSSAAAPTVTLTAKKAGSESFIPAEQLSVAVGTEITLKADVSVAGNESGESELTYQWYVSKVASADAAEPIEGEDTSGKIDGLGGTLTYTVKGSEKADTLYYFVKVKNTVSHTDGTSDDVIATSENTANSAILEVEYTEPLPECGTAESFESGDGKAATPYIIATPEQLKLMQVKINSSEEADKDYRSASYKLKNDINFGGALWTAAGSSSNTAFTGTFDGAGHKINGLNITASDVDYAGFIGYADGATVTNVTVSGSMKAKRVKYAGGVVAYSAGKASLTDIVNEININSDTVVRTAGITGYAASAAKVINCVNHGNITVTTDNSSDIYEIASGYGDSYAAGIAAGSPEGTSNAYTYSVYNCVNTGNIASSLRKKHPSNSMRMWTAGIITPDSGNRYIKTANNLNYGVVSQTGSSASTSAQPILASSYLGGRYITVDNCYDMSSGSNDADTVMSSLSKWTADNAATSPDARSWSKSESGILYPTGSALIGVKAPKVTLEVKTGDGEFTKVGKDMVKVKTGTSVVLKAIIDTPDNATGDSKVTYEWYKVASADKSAAAVVASGEIKDGISGEVEYLVTSDSYTEDYYYIKVVNTVSYAEKSGIDLTVSDSVESDVCGIIFNTGSGAYEGEVSTELEGEGTEAAPFLIKSEADLRFMQQQINAGTAKYANAKVYYRLEKDLDLNNVRWTSIGTFAKHFYGIFDGNNHVIKNVAPAGYQQYASLFGYIQNAEVKNLTVQGVINAQEGANDAAGVVGTALNSQIVNCTSEVNITVKRYRDANISSPVTYVGGIVGYLSSSVVANCANRGTITLENKNASPGSYMGGIAGSMTGIYSNTSSPYHQKSIINSYNTGDVNVIIEDAATSAATTIGGIVGNLNGIVENCMNSGNISEEVAEGAESALAQDMIGGITGYMSAGTANIALKNCVSYGKVSAKLSKATAVTGASVANAGRTAPKGIYNCYAVASLGADKVFMVAGTATPQGENGYIDPDTGAITCGTFAADGTCTPTGSVYIRTDAVKAAMGSDDSRPEIYFALNTWAGNNNTNSTYNSWTQLEGTSVYAPAGTPEKSPFASANTSNVLAVGVENTGDFENTFTKDDVIPAMKIQVSGSAASIDGVKYIYRWYSSLKESMANSTLLANNSEDGSTYTPSFTPGRYYYAVDVTAVSGQYYITSAMSKSVKVLSESDYWAGEAADIEELAGYGTEEKPYIIDTPEKLALITDYLIKNGTKVPSDREEYPNDPDDKNKQAVAFNEAYFKITKNLDMGGVAAFRPIGGSAYATAQFKGHIYGEDENGNRPIIKNLYLSSDTPLAYTSNKCLGLVGYMYTGSSVENLIFENVKLDIDPSKTDLNGVVAGRVWGGTIKNVDIISGEATVGDISSGTIKTGAVAGDAKAADIENCVNRMNITVNEANPTGSYTAQTGGIVGYADVSKFGTITDMTVKNCINEGNVSGYARNNASATGGIIGRIANSNARMQGKLVFENNKNTGRIAGNINIGGLIGSFEYGADDSTGFARNCYNTGDVSLQNDNASSSAPAYVGGLVGKLGANISTCVKIENCYNTGKVTSEASGNNAYIATGNAIGYAMLADAEKIYTVAQEGLNGVGHINSSASTVDIKTVTADELASTETAVGLGTAFYQKADAAPVLEFEVDEADRCNIDIESADKDLTAYFKSGQNLVKRLNAVNGTTVKFKTSAGLGYEVTSVKNGDTELVAADGVYTVKADAPLKLTASVAKAAGTAVIINDYQAAPEGKMLVAYRMTDKLADGEAVYLGDSEMIHASAFDDKIFVVDTKSLGHVDIGGKSETVDATYVIFVDEETSIDDITSQIVVKKKDASAAAVDYTDYNILGDADLDVFDAQLVWDLAKGKGLSATDIQRLQADYNKDGAITVQDVLMVHDAIINGIKSDIKSVIG